MNSFQTASKCRGLRLVLLSAGIMVAASAVAEPAPYIAYAYPSGGQRGTTFEIEMGGYSMDAYDVDYFAGGTGGTGGKSYGVNPPDFNPKIYVSGEGVEVKILTHFRQLADQGDRPRIRNRQQRLEQTINKARPAEKRLMQQELDAIKKCWADQKAEERRLRLYFKDMKRKQFNPQLSERMTARITIAPDAPSGQREMRLITAFGVSNPIYFHVGTLPETEEKEPNDDNHHSGNVIESLPALVNGQIFPGDIDHISFKATKGQKLVINTYARKLIPYLADAVPGWFQATLSLYDETGREVAYDDDFKFQPDPVILYDVPKTGIYTVEIHDAIYRGRQDFVYRIEIGELPFITSIYPLGAKKGSSAKIELTGWNLPKDTLEGVMPSESPDVRLINIGEDPYKSNPVPFAMGEFPEFLEQEPNAGKTDAHMVRMPIIVNGRIQEPGDWDTYGFYGTRGQQVVIEVLARTLGSTLDSVIKLVGPNGKIIAANDDYVDKEGYLFKDPTGLNTHHADSYLIEKLPATGRYYVYIGDVQAKGSPERAYRMRISPAIPDYLLRLDPSGVNIAPGGLAAFTVNVIRMDGFTGPIKLEAEDLPEGFEMSTDTIPADVDKLRFTLSAPKRFPEQVVKPKIIGKAHFGGRNMVRKAIPTDNRMQAFLWRFLVPAQEIVLARSAPAPFSFNVSAPSSGLRLPINKEVYVKVTAKRNEGVPVDTKSVKFILDNPPDGILLTKGGMNVNKLDGGFTLKADSTVPPGTKATLIVKGKSKRGRTETYFPLPAVPIQVVGSAGGNQRVARGK